MSSNNAVIVDYLKRVSVLKTVCYDFAFGKIVQPTEFSAIMLATVKVTKPLIAFFQLFEKTRELQKILKFLKKNLRIVLLMAGSMETTAETATNPNLVP